MLPLVFTISWHGELRHRFEMVHELLACCTLYPKHCEVIAGET